MKKLKKNHINEISPFCIPSDLFIVVLLHVLVNFAAECNPDSVIFLDVLHVGASKLTIFILSEL